MIRSKFTVGDRVYWKGKTDSLGNYLKYDGRIVSIQANEFVNNLQDNIQCIPSFNILTIDMGKDELVVIPEFLVSFSEE